MKNKHKIKIKLDQRNLSCQTLFWLALFIPVFLFLITGCQVWKNTNFGLNKEAYDNFLDISRFPLILLSLCLPLVGIVVYMHRTIQTETQIAYAQHQFKNSIKQLALTKKKNTADSYYSHSKYIEDAFKSLPEKTFSTEQNESEQPLKIIRPHSLYKSIYPKSNVIDGYSTTANHNFLKNLAMHFEEIKKALAFADDDKADSTQLISSLERLETHIYLLSSILCLNYNPNSKIYNVGTTPYIYPTSFNTEEKLKDMLLYLYELTLSISDVIDIKMEYLDFQFNQEDTLLHYIFGTSHMFSKILPTDEINVTTKKFKLQTGY